MGIYNKIQNYIDSLEKEISIGNYTEHSFRPILKILVESLDKELIAINEPKRTNSGAPDFLITKNNFPIGYIETKKLGESLDQVEESEQLLRYRHGIHNLVLTNYTEFRWYTDGKRKLTAKLALVDNKQQILRDKDFTEFMRLTGNFLNTSTEINDSEELGKRMAIYASYIKNELRQLLNSDKEVQSLRQQLEGFRRILLEELSEDELADMYAQTICYGLFAARCTISKKDKLIRHNASYVIPKTNPFLRKMFNAIVGPDLNEKVAWVVDDLVKLLNSTNIDKIVTDSIIDQDPIIHFYEIFLSYYDQSIRNLRGVFFTPKPIVSYMVRSVNFILKNRFNISDGLADSNMIKNSNGKELHKVQILDPATGTGTFLNEIIGEIYKSFEKNKGMWSEYVSKHLLPRLYGFELLMAPYTVSHMKLSLRLKEMEYDISNNERLRVYLTNSLEEAHEMVEQPLFSYWLAEEANAAREVKSEVPVMVVVGNPPYVRDSVNNNDWIKSLVRDYYYIDNEPLKEKNTKGLQDDYVKFIRLGQWRIEQTGIGILAFITNHAYLDNATFRGMRRNLMKSFDEIFILNLHGNSRKHERTPNGEVDENVFDIEQGVAITLFIKHEEKKEEGPKIFYSDLWGKQKEKYNFLETEDINSTKWCSISPSKPFYFFVPHDLNNFEEYQYGWKISEIFNMFSNGVVTARDNFTIDWAPDIVWEKVQNFISLDVESARHKYNLREDVRDWKVTFAQKDVINSGLNRELIKPIMYRPFDTRYTYYTGNSRGFICMPRKGVMSNLLNGNNLALITSRFTKGENFRHAFVSKTISDAAFLSSKTSNNAFVFPLYLVDTGEPSLIQNLEKQHNFNDRFISDIEEKLGLKFNTKKSKQKNVFGPEEILGYIYSILFSNSYRERYKDYLKTDFPYIPITANKELFFRLCMFGMKLASLHLFNKQLSITANFPKAGTNKIDAIKYKTVENNTGKVFINKIQYFDNVGSEVWNYQIGGYKVCEKWLKSRNGRKLTYEDLVHFQRIDAIIRETIKLQNKIDEKIESSGGWPLN